MQALFARKGRRAFVDVDVREGGVIVLDRAVFVDFMPQAAGDDVPVHAHVVGIDADAARFLHFPDDVGRRDHDFRGDAAAVQTGAAEAVPFDDGDAQALPLGRVGNNIGSAGANDDDIIVVHTYRLLLYTNFVCF